MTTPVAVTAQPTRAASALVRAAFGTALAGNTVGAVGFPLFVLESTGSTGLTGAAVTAAVAASVLTGLLMGPVLDRWGCVAAGSPEFCWACSPPSLSSYCTARAHCPAGRCSRSPRSGPRRTSPAGSPPSD